MKIDIKKLGSARIQATVIVQEDIVKSADEEVVKELGKAVKIKGFRPGMAPVSILKANLSPEQIQEAIVQKFMPDIMKELMGSHALQPIIRPHVMLKSMDPMTIEIVIVERPASTVNVKKVKKAIKERKGSGGHKEAKETKDAKESEKVEESEEHKRAREQGEVLDQIALHTEVELATELIDEEVRDLVRDQTRMLANYGIDLEQWLLSQKKTVDDMIKEMRPDAEKRLRIRFGIGSLIDKWSVSVSDDDMSISINELLAPLNEDEKSKVIELYQPGGRAYEQFKFQKTVEKVLEHLSAE